MKKRKNKLTLKKISHTVKVLLDIVGDTLYWSSSRGLMYAVAYGGMHIEAEKRHYKEEARKKRALYELQRQKLITLKRKGDRLFVSITEKGFLNSLQYRLRDAVQCPKGECVVVTFDIPESEREIRRRLRVLLVTNGFWMLHRSVWCTDSDVLDTLQQWILRAHAEPWVYVFRAYGIGGMGEKVRK